MPYFYISSTFMFKFSMYEVNHSYQVHLLNGQPSAVCCLLDAHNECLLLFAMTILDKFDSE